MGAYPGVVRANNGASCRNVFRQRLSPEQQRALVEGDLRSIFGAHLTFMLDSAHNPELTDAERCAVNAEIDDLVRKRPSFCGSLAFTVPAPCQP